MSTLIFKIILINLSITFVISRNTDGIPDYDLHFTELVERNGYPIETHEIVSRDGYLLAVFRIPYGRNGTNNTIEGSTRRQPILLVHGLIGTADNYITLGPDKALGYTLAGRDYDVWFLNCKGTLHSRKHKTLDPDKDPEFWKYSWNEIGINDLPAVIDYILDLTGYQQIYYIGHSQGCTSFFVMASELPEYNKKIKLMIGLGPAVFLGQIKQPLIKLVAGFYPFLSNLTESNNLMEFIPFVDNAALRQILKKIVLHKSALRDMFLSILLPPLSPGPGQMSEDLLPLIFNAAPGGASVRQPLHYAHLIVSKRFIKYDFGKKQNMRIYGRKDPPSYNLKNVNCPVALFYGDKDELCGKEDVTRLSRELPNLAGLYEVPFKGYTHTGFIFAKDNDKLLNPYIFQLLDKY